MIKLHVFGLYRISRNISQKKRQFLFDAILPGIWKMVVHTIPTLTMDTVRFTQAKFYYIIHWWERFKDIQQNIIAYLILPLFIVLLHISIELEPIAVRFIVRQAYLIIHKPSAPKLSKNWMPDCPRTIKLKNVHRFVLSWIVQLHCEQSHILCDANNINKFYFISINKDFREQQI